jgi:hypothetical protein
MSKKNIKNALQSWYNSACWYGYVETEIGRLTDFEVSTLANKLNVKLEYTMCS